jgi:hypothetical protein
MDCFDDWPPINSDFLRGMFANDSITQISGPSGLAVLCIQAESPPAEVAAANHYPNLSIYRNYIDCQLIVLSE